MKGNFTKILVFIIFSVFVILFKLGFHELWKDEWQAYFVARDMSIAPMLNFLNYEGHPSLWYIILKAGALLEFGIRSDLIIQITHYFIVLLFYYIFFFKIRMPLWLKVLFLLSYFFCFEYAIVNRAYIILGLLGYLIIYNIQNHNSESWLVSMALFLLCQTEVYGVFIGGALLIYLLIYSSTTSKFINDYKKSIVAYIAGIIVFVITVFPRGHQQEFSRAYIGNNLDWNVIFNSFQGDLANVFFPGLISDTSSLGYSIYGLIISIAVLVILFYLFRNNRAILWSLGFMILSMIMFHAFIFKGGLRNWGVIFIYFSMMLALIEDVKFDNSRFNILLSILLIFPILHNFKAIHFDYLYPFSNGKAAGEFLKENVPDAVPIIGLNQFETSSAIGYSGRPFYEMNEGKSYTYFRWLDKVYVPTEEELQLFAKYKNVGGVIVVSNEPIDKFRYPKCQLWKTLNEKSLKREDFYIYTLSLK